MSTDDPTARVGAPIGMLAELTHRCPLQCPYCSNPLELDRRSAELDTATWLRVFDEAAVLGIMQVHLSGGEPTARQDLEEIIARCAGHGLYSNLITSGVGISADRFRSIVDAGLDHVQLSFQDTIAESNDLIGGNKGAMAQKLALAERVRAEGLPLTVNAVIHRRNIARVEDFVRLAISLGAKRVEIAHAQYYGWALKNRANLMPTRAQTLEAVATVERLRAELKGIIVIDAVVPDYYARFPKPCMGGWGRQSMNVSPAGKVLPCHAAETIPGLDFWNVTEHSLGDIWRDSPAFNAFRGTAWMPEPCQSCERRTLDWGGCRCQALAIAGDAALTDPACEKSPMHARMAEMAEAEADTAIGDYDYRRFSRRRETVSAQD